MSFLKISLLTLKILQLNIIDVTVLLRLFCLLCLCYFFITSHTYNMHYNQTLVDHQSYSRELIKIMFNLTCYKCHSCDASNTAVINLMKNVCTISISAKHHSLNHHPSRRLNMHTGEFTVYRLYSLMCIINVSTLEQRLWKEASQSGKVHITYI